MKSKDIQNFELGEHCSGHIIRVNGKDYEDLSKKEKLEFINDMLLNDINAANLMLDTFKNCLEYLQYKSTESSSDSCDQCGN